MRGTSCTFMQHPLSRGLLLLYYIRKELMTDILCMTEHAQISQLVGHEQLYVSLRDIPKLEILGCIQEHVHACTQTELWLGLFHNGQNTPKLTNTVNRESCM